jgi:hypothetical protein
MTTATYKAIETHYKGYRFRSRLEARWAVFFDRLEITWEYEPQGYKLSDGSLYLPDFFLPSIDIYVEVKPNVGFDDAMMIGRQFAADSRKGVLLAIGVPEPKGYWVCFADHDAGGGFIWFGGEGRARSAALIAASNAAKSARFEHGESPNAPWANKIGPKAKLCSPLTPDDLQKGKRLDELLEKSERCGLTSDDKAELALILNPKGRPTIGP